MKFPEGFDPLAVKVFALNACHFFDQDSLDKADARLSKLFSNAKSEHYLLAEMPRLCILRLEPHQIDEPAFKKLHAALEMHISPDRATSAGNGAGWKKDPEAWKSE
jgi:hypothetical protein